MGRGGKDIFFNLRLNFCLFECLFEKGWGNRRLGDGQRMMITYGKGEAMEGRRYLLEELSDGWM